MRKIIQIVACGEDATLFALCDDGSVWHQQIANNTVVWVKEPDIPQQDEEIQRKSSKRRMA